MCGIVGIINGGETTSATVARMNAELVHRGPDDQGQLDGPSASIAMRRLAVIDLAGGHQPMSNDEQTLHIVFNGEIYNYRELRQQLIATARHRFVTESDTEVVLRLFAEYGEDAPSFLHGMFAFCILDTRRQTAFLARDRFGEKPLFYAQLGEQFIFSSELTSLLQCADIPRRLNYEALFYFLRHGVIPHPLTMFDGVMQLCPGESLTFSGGRTHTRQFHKHTSSPNPAYNDDERAAAAIRETLLDAVGRQMVSDVPLGGFLSGGIDSSAIVAAMQRASGQPVSTFNVRFEQAAYDESPIARSVARHLGTQHHELTVQDDGFHPEDLSRIIEHVGQPFYDTSAVPTYFLTKFARAHTTVCLSGDGGDELFAGYDYFLWQTSLERVSRYIPKTAAKLAHAISRRVCGQSTFSNISRLRQIRQSFAMLAMPFDARVWQLGPFFDECEMAAIASPPLQDRWNSLARSRVENIVQEGNDLSKLRKLMRFRVSFSLANNMLVKVDRMSMANSLEVRAPMLDVKMANLAAEMPDHQLLRGGTTKYVLRKAIEPWLPSEVFTHPKKGFDLPVHAYQNRAYANLCQETFGDDHHALVTLFNIAAVKKIVERGTTRQRDGADVSLFRATHQVWMLLQIAVWLTRFNVEL